MKHQYLINNQEVTVQLINHPQPIIEFIVDRHYLKLVVYRKAQDGLNMYLSLDEAKAKHYSNIKIPYLRRSIFCVFSFHLN